MVDVACAVGDSRSLMGADDAATRSTKAEDI
jgi:hypothetical protein